MSLPVMGCTIPLTTELDGGNTVDSGHNHAGLDSGIDGRDTGPVTEICAPDGGASRDAGPSPGIEVCGCTRRPPSPNSFQCPRGVGESTSAHIGPAGGVLELQGRQGLGAPARLDFPPTAFVSTTTVTLTETSIPPPFELLDWSPLYRVEPLGMMLQAATPIRVPFGNLSGPVQPDLAIWFSVDGVCFTRVWDSYTNAGFSQGSIEQLGYLVVGAPRSGPTIDCP